MVLASLQKLSCSALKVRLWQHFADLASWPGRVRKADVPEGQGSGSLTRPLYWASATDMFFRPAESRSLRSKSL